MADISSRSDESQEQRSSPEHTGLASKLSHGASEVTDQALDRVQRTRVRLEDELAQRRSRFGERLRSVSEVLDSAGGKLGDDDLVADGLHYVGSRLDRVASYIESADPNQLAYDLRDVARERPAWFFGGVFVLGLALGRFAKSSAEALAADAEEDTGIGATRARAPGYARSAGQSAGRAPASTGESTAFAAQTGGSAGAAGSAREATTGLVRPQVPRPNQGTRQP